MSRFIVTVLILSVISGFLFLFFLVLPPLMTMLLYRDSFHEINTSAGVTAQIEFAIRSTSKVIGVSIALASAVMLVQRLPQGQETTYLLTCALLLLGGVLVFEPNWGTALAFGLVFVAHTAYVVSHTIWGHSARP